MKARFKIQIHLGTKAAPEVCVEADAEKEPQPFLTFACLDAVFEAFSRNDSQPAGPERDLHALDGTQTLGLSIQGADAMTCSETASSIFLGKTG